MDQMAGPESGRIQPPKNYHNVLLEEGVALSLSDTSTSAYELFDPAGLIYCRRGTDNIIKLIEIVRDCATDTQDGDLNRILNLFAKRDAFGAANRIEFRKMGLTTADTEPEKWISIRQMIEAIGISVDQLISKPKLPQIMSELAATGTGYPDLDTLEPLKFPLAEIGPYGLGTQS